MNVTEVVGSITIHSLSEEQYVERKYPSSGVPNIPVLHYEMSNHTILQDDGDPLLEPEGLILEDGINWEEEFVKITYPPNCQYKKDSEERSVLNILKITKYAVTLQYPPTN